MKAPKFPTNEAERIKAVKSYSIIDTLPESDYDNLTELAATICDVPIALITMLDKERNFFKSHYGISLSESPRDLSFCGHAILENDIFIINDAREDIRFIDNPLLEEQNVVFYAGVPLLDPSGYKLGTICIFDHEPRELNRSQIKALKTLGQQVVNLLELRKKNSYLNLIKGELEERNTQLKSFASLVSHDLKSPLSNIIALTDLLKEDNQGNLSDDSLQYIYYIEDSTTVLKDYIDGILMYYSADELLTSAKEDIKLSDIADDIKHILISNNEQLLFNDAVIKNVNKSALSQILINLVDNALKYNDKEDRIVEIKYELLPTHHKFSVIDNGIGIALNQQEQIFEIFKTIKNDFSKSNTGIGLSTVKNLVEKLNGQISVVSEIGKGSTFSFTIE
ncbi:fused adenylate cyclase and hybrid sensor diguanylate cyclase and response regulator [Winogradskyella psychrotolerans RS-3]|uniref:histidine kinase n=1 Tax=Winogradskyella psychrotolerans RS-3 TaxID=641526 RepID=S7X3M6_9FLAO|nr:GAF domain-containing sensor histidine kinase [Winogradskyella psychrotolerans]EPR73624.1 fused adenylate cyclase and hybrid sensor diguanylate cyclase and response regulator [Winogradskyella psychrotolerans RS-3]